MRNTKTFFYLPTDPKDGQGLGDFPTFGLDEVQESLGRPVSIGGKDEFHLQAPALRIAFGLIQAVSGRKAFLLGLDQGQSNGLGIGIDLDSENIEGQTNRSTESARESMGHGSIFL